MSLQFKTELVINAPPAKVAAVFSDMNQWQHFMKGLVRVEKLTDGPFGKGTQFRETRKMFGKEASEFFEVKLYEPPKRIHLYVDGSKGQTGKGEFFFNYDFIAEAGGTRLIANSEIKMPGFFAKLLGKLMIKVFKKACDRDLISMKQYIETGKAAV
ncbi:MAG: SRPBCC family protein [Planctomycetota bacterium]